jgi:hypothetical protein
VIFTSHAEMAIVVTMRFLSQMATLCPVRIHIKTFDLEDIHVDSHAENDKGGGTHESEISEKLEWWTS